MVLNETKMRRHLIHKKIKADSQIMLVPPELARATKLMHRTGTDTKHHNAERCDELYDEKEGCKERHSVLSLQLRENLLYS